MAPKWLQRSVAVLTPRTLNESEFMAKKKAVSRTTQSPIYAIPNWQEVYEKHDTRKAKFLSWISFPVDFNSVGYQTLLDQFEGTTAAALYGAYVALLKVAATAPVRGQLADSAGVPYSPSRIGRITGLPSQLFEKLIPWAVSNGHLVCV